MKYPFEVSPITDEIVKLIGSKGELTYYELETIGIQIKEFIDWRLRQTFLNEKLILRL